MAAGLSDLEKFQSQGAHLCRAKVGSPQILCPVVQRGEELLPLLGISEVLCAFARR